jgi:hypothetical protein
LNHRYVFWQILESRQIIWSWTAHFDCLVVFDHIFLCTCNLQ